MGAKYTATAAFSGIGGFCLGFERAGIPTTQAIELDELACETYKANFPNTRIIQADIRKIKRASHKLEATDILHAGFPCQSFSQAGGRKGFADPRGRLVFDLLRLIKEFGDDRPSVLVLENAPFFRIGQGGAWFMELAKEIKKAGYWFRESNCQELDAFDLTELPQQRRRLFMVAFATNRFRNGKFQFPEPGPKKNKNLAEYVDFSGEKDDFYYLSPENRYYKMISDEVPDGPSLCQLRKYVVRSKKQNICPTLTANMGQGGHNVPFLRDRRGLRKLTEHECATLQGFPASFVFPESIVRSRRYTQIGNSVVAPVAQALAVKIRTKIEQERDS